MIEAFDTIEAHRVLGFRTAALAAPTLALEDTSLPIFDIETMWRRGRFYPSLFADSALRSEAWRARYAAEGLPLLPSLPPATRIGPDPWRWLARENGREERGLQKRSGLSKAAFTCLCQLGEQHHVLFSLPFWRGAREPITPDRLLYWTDPGALHWHLGLSERLLVNWHLPPPDGPTEVERRFLQRPREKSWEGFAISSLLRAAGVRATGKVWRAPDGEIDLILVWSEAPSIWAIEVTLGRNKRLSPVFEEGCRLTQAARGIVVCNARVGKPTVKWPRGLSRAVEVMTLEEALREVMAGS